MTTSEQYDYNVIVIGAGISGLGAALKLKDAGLNVLVLEKNDHVGGRMSTDHIQCQDGNPDTAFAIDRGATIFGAKFHRMKALVKKLQLEHLAEDFNFAFGLQDKKQLLKIRRARLDDVLFSDKISFGNKMAMMRFGMEVMRHRNKLGHGNSGNALQLDNLSVEAYMKKIGGTELLENILMPGLNGPMGGHLKTNSRLILFQTFWNILLMKTWAIKGGMDSIIKAMVKKLNVRTGIEVVSVRFQTIPEVTETSSCQVELSDGSMLTARNVIIALPGNLAAKLCTQLPQDILRLLRETKYSEMLSAHVMLNRCTETNCAGYGIAKEVDSGYEIELEHNRVKELCPPGKGLASIYFWNENGNRVTDLSDDEIKSRAENIIRNRFPECADAILGTHIIRWKEGIVQFPPGRLTQMSKLREEMKTWNLPIQLCGDYLDGIASESALATGEEAAENVWRRESIDGRLE